MGQRIKQRRDVAANWTVANPVLQDGEQGFDKTSKCIKIGDGVTAWNSLGWVKTDYTNIINKPTLFNGDYNALTNKPTIPAAQVQSDWNAASGLGVILNKPVLFSGDYNALTNKPAITDPTTATLDGGAAGG